MTVQAAFRQGIDYLTEHKITDAEASARFLLAHTLDITSGQLAAHLRDELTEEQFPSYQQLLERRSKHEPVWYIVGNQEFCQLPIFADNRVLIPRPETEELVNYVLDYIEDSSVDSVIEIGTGSGAIILAIADQLKTSHPEIDLLATDVSSDALLVAHYNARTLNFDEKVTFIEANLLQPKYSEEALSADVIVANLPYVPTDRIAQLEPDVRDFEPHLALDGGTDGLEKYRTLFEQIKQLEYKPKVIFCEIDETHDLSFAELVRSQWPQARLEIKKDLVGLIRFAIIAL